MEVTRSSSGTKLEVHIEGTTYSNSSNEIVIFSNGTIMEKPKVKGGKSLLRLQKAKREWGSDFPSSSSVSDWFIHTVIHFLHDREWFFFQFFLTKVVTLHACGTKFVSNLFVFSSSDLFNYFSFLSLTVE